MSMVTYERSSGGVHVPPECSYPAIAADDAFNTSSDAALVFFVRDARNDIARNTSLVVAGVRDWLEPRNDNEPKTIIFD